MTASTYNWVRFLRNYGPIPTNGNLFDEHVTAALEQAKVQPIVLPTAYVEDMTEFLLGGRNGSIVVAGTAGDGKTYHCRQLWQRLGGSPNVWASKSPVKTLSLVDGRTLVFVKDLSELNSVDGDEILAGFSESVLYGNDACTYVIATNHGQILDRLRRGRDEDGKTSPLYQIIQDAFLTSGFQYDRLKVYDLSHSTQRQTLADVIRVVTEHPGWDGCESCSLNQGDRICPIFQNRKRAIGQDDSGRFGRRLGDLVEIARLNGAHLPIRDLLALVANMLLGHPEAKEGLMTCLDVAGIQDRRTVDLASIYRNVFAANLSTRRAMNRPVFRTLASFGIGRETTNGVDGLLVYGSDDSRLQDDFQALVACDEVYGATPEFLAQQRQYLEGDESARGDDGAEAFLERLTAQRQRLFFTLPDEVKGKYPFWGLTAFQFADEYLELLGRLSAEDRRRPVEEKTRARMVQGLNRVMTGLLLDNPDSIFVATSGGFTQSRISVLCENTLPSRREGGVGMRFDWDKTSSRPSLDISVGDGAKGAVLFELTPVRFEFLCRVSEGALPSSFSNECFEDLLAFKARLLRQIEITRAVGQQENDDDFEAENALGLTFIEIEKSGLGFLKRISVRIPE